MTVLLTGANGQVGWEVGRQFSIAGLRCCALRHSELDITSRKAVFDRVAEARPLVVVNAAAYTAVDKAEADPDTAFSVNCEGPKLLAGACAEVGALLIHLSTDYVFDGTKQNPYTEADAVGPVSVYGASKLAGEEAIQKYCPLHVILRTSWVYGVHGNNFVRSMLRLADERSILKVVDDQFGTPTSAYDIASVIIRLVSSFRLGPWPRERFGTFHCAGSGQTTWCGFAREIFAQTRRNVMVEPIGTKQYHTPARRPAYSVLDCRKLARVHGSTLRPWQLALGDMLAQMNGHKGQREDQDLIASGAGR